MFQVPAGIYDRHVGRYGAALSAAHIEAAGPPAGATALDIGCGPGALTVALAARLGADHVCALDPSPGFVEACRARAPGVDVRVGTAEALPELGRVFDLVSSQLVVNFVEDPDAAMREMLRVARPGATITAVTWDYAGEMWMLRRFWDAALAVDPAAPDEAAMKLCTAPELAGLWQRSGLADIETRPLVVEAAYDSFDDYWEPFLGGLGPSGAYVATLDGPRTAALRDELDRRLGSPRGRFTLTARAWFVRGTAPAR